MTNTGLSRLARDLGQLCRNQDNEALLWRCRVELALLYIEEGRVALAAELLREGLE